MSTVWIKVLDELPPLNTMFDVWHRTRGRITDHGPYRGDWHEETIKSVLILQGITHWSLPTPPSGIETMNNEPEYSVITLTSIPEGVKKELFNIQSVKDLFNSMVDMKPTELVCEDSFDCAFWSTETHFDPNCKLDFNRRPLWATKILFMHKRDLEYA